MSRLEDTFLIRTCLRDFFAILDALMLFGHSLSKSTWRPPLFSPWPSPKLFNYHCDIYHLEHDNKASAYLSKL